jgi:hypothetical protein
MASYMRDVEVLFDYAISELEKGVDALAREHGVHPMDVQKDICLSLEAYARQFLDGGH